MTAHYVYLMVYLSVLTGYRPAYVPPGGAQMGRMLPVSPEIAAPPPPQAQPTNTVRTSSLVTNTDLT